MPEEPESAGDRTRGTFSRRRAQPVAEVDPRARLFAGFLAGSGPAAALSAASVLQSAYPHLRGAGLPLAAVAGLLLGWTLAWPFAHLLARRLDPANAQLVAALAAALGLAAVSPACVFGAAIGLEAFSPAIVLLGVFLGLSGLVWGGYLSFDSPDEFSD